MRVYRSLSRREYDRLLRANQSLFSAFVAMVEFLQAVHFVGTIFSTIPDLDNYGSFSGFVGDSIVSDWLGRPISSGRSIQRFDHTHIRRRLGKRIADRYTKQDTVRKVFDHQLILVHTAYRMRPRRLSAMKFINRHVVCARDKRMRYVKVTGASRDVEKLSPFH